MGQEEGLTFTPGPYCTEVVHMEAVVTGRGRQGCRPSAGSLLTLWRAMGFCGAWIWEFEPSSPISQRPWRLQLPSGLGTRLQAS